MCCLEDDRMRFLGCGWSPPAGWAKGRIADQNAVAESMLAALREAETRCARSPWRAP